MIPRKLCLTGFTFLLLIAKFNSPAQENVFLMPQTVSSEVSFGMLLADFKKSADMSTMRVDKTRDWRTVYFQPSDAPEVKSLIYFFDNNQVRKPLYEITIQYLSEEMAQKKALNFFGPPNYSGADDVAPEEWRFKSSDAFAKWAWVYKDKIVIVARVPETDWDEDWDEN